MKFDLNPYHVALATANCENKSCFPFARKHLYNETAMEEMICYIVLNISYSSKIIFNKCSLWMSTS